MRWISVIDALPKFLPGAENARTEYSAYVLTYVVYHNKQYCSPMVCKYCRELDSNDSYWICEDCTIVGFDWAGEVIAWAPIAPVPTEIIMEAIKS